jgi:hypothetical protein
MKINNYLLLAFFCCLVFFSAPSITLDLLGLTSIKHLSSKFFLLSMVILIVYLSKMEIFILRKPVIWLLFVFVYSIFIIASYIGWDLYVSVYPFIGAALKVMLFLLLISFTWKIQDAVFRQIFIIIYLLLFLGLLATIFHNILGFDEFYRISELDQRSSSASVLLGSLSTSRIFINDIAVYRLSSIFYEPSNYAFIIYLFFILVKIYKVNTTKIIFLIIANMVSTFSLGLYLVLSLHMLNFFKMIYEKTLRMLAFYILVISMFIYLLLPYIQFVIARLKYTESDDGMLIVAYDRLYNNGTPSNIWIGDGSFLGGFDSIFSIFYQYGILGAIIFCLPVLIVAIKLFQHKSVVFGIGLLIFLVFKPNILTPLILLMLALIWQKLTLSESTNSLCQK